MAKKQKQHKSAGRPPGPKIPCGACGAELTATEWRKHFGECPKKPAKAA